MSELLRDYDTHDAAKVSRFTLTDAEREAVEWAACEADEYEEDEPLPHQHAATLRGLLERLGGER